MNLGIFVKAFSNKFVAKNSCSHFRFLKVQFKGQYVDFKDLKGSSRIFKNFQELSETMKDLEKP